MIRSGYEIEDIKLIVKAALGAITSSPFSAWQVILGFPEWTTYETQTKALIYIDTPVKIATLPVQGGLPMKIWEMTIGTWDNRKLGGDEEINIINSQLLNFFDNPQTRGQQTFTVKLGATTYTTKTMIYHGISVMEILGPRRIETEDPKEFRSEFSLTVRT